FEVVIQKAEEHYSNALSYGYYLLLSCLGFLLIVILVYAKKRIFFGLTLGLSFVALELLAEGISNPILEMSAFKKDMTIKFYVKPADIPYIKEFVEYVEKVTDFTDIIEYIPYYGPKWAKGAKDLIGEGQAFLSENANSKIGFDKVFPGRTYFYYQNKGIMDLISLLYHNGNKPVALAIATFSIVIPFIKLLFTLLILLFPVHGLKRMRKALSYIAKWSMADVFVVGAFLAYLSFANMSPGVEMDAQVLFGLYYFGGYVIISILLGTLLDRSIKEKVAILENENPANDEGSLISE
ncbi:MAG: paraquat-inducible protein A, partial [Crocinitomicaceae bacterium]|nr:paraquat-inducible protein A [Crocinitomicaceae bacterium]